MNKSLLVSPSPHLTDREDVPYIMKNVVLALLPAVFASVYFFGLRALLIIFVSVATAIITEIVFLYFRKKELATVLDFTAVLTGLLVALTLPPSVDLSIVAIGAFIAIAMGKQVFGGFGHNVFNPALVGRAFLQAAFPVAMTTWIPTRLMKGVDAVTFATPLGGFKFSHIITQHKSLLLGNTGGSLGETSAILLLLGGVYLLIRRFIDWRIPASAMLFLILFTGVVRVVGGSKYPDPLFMLLAGGFILGIWFMATDPVTSPVNPKAVWLYGTGIALFVVIIRLFGGMPEGVMYSILLMNGITPLLDRFTKKRMLGEQK